ncbi:MliC family protein [Serratia proteamaculans]|jgi:membrane-bound inhibitor of C-type lysozyme|uniref:MliC family protein n=1 Tax=Serratia proteamaculans TaxID=28151 RepID=UPI0021780AA4|nr:MliC family protein [Serratia proteamaculans]CAI0860545.1 Membrane-bound lysozyme inhibitor of C-type lysozyme precursor [Serratia proteamaculans]CAI1513761.1 Membrane-bound lysozyme inhibitor of C-type lysozyme precursor [Serratia proteamaculans]CAI1649257.1 Membrane-bound lysozyme inhibitor of C-type lysozyme precursor [Serratia proteamaculans]CAI2432970.1 Membrane-bound lysozyme inhibitor of C-type lysozyme precursor [Serratia proteamaculans]
MKKIIIAAGALALAGCSYVLPQNSQTLHYQCGTTPLTVSLDGKESTVSLLMDGEQLKLKQVLAMSGAKYSDGKYTFWSKGQNAYLERNGKVIMSDCTLTN